MGRATPFPQPELRHWKSGENEAELLVQQNVTGKSKEKSCTYGTPLPVSPINEVRRVIDYARMEIPPQKLFVGIPNYGYDWPLPYVRGETRAQSLGNVQAVERALARGVAIEYDETAQAPFYNYYDRPETYADAVEHIVWFENARSSEAMLRLVAEYGMTGAGVWNIMRYFPSLWLVANQLYTIRKFG